MCIGYLRLSLCPSDCEWENNLWQSSFEIYHERDGWNSTVTVVHATSKDAVGKRRIEFNSSSRIEVV